ncbi:hypothetical protein OG400_12510 [Micromonospora ureilytica]|uniref:hypothetical protein n=1 Tax=Micromonospora ureilytica TaxID=709868 RepID=UPI002E0D2278|nr:hypothetical protein OG400_12510 [Micromonospora ureilytica]
MLGIGAVGEDICDVDAVLFIGVARRSERMAAIPHTFPLAQPAHLGGDQRDHLVPVDLL